MKKFIPWVEGLHVFMCVPIPAASRSVS